MTMTITIRQNEFDEYEVPTGIVDDGYPAIYYTDDKADAFDTARHFHGIIADITFRRGTYAVDEQARAEAEDAAVQLNEQRAGA